MKKRIHYKNFVPKCKRWDLNQIFFKLNTNPRRFDFREMKPIERYKAMIKAVAEAVKKKEGFNEVTNQTA